ncbi:phosphate ABC transporter permease PstA [Ponticaulis koreensis]|uniref:phosphate ABC transporter permease PstA n=1 Tax=Ponticaulis koreensis TaxID=1123045 RepID=UPI0003B532D1|nr:phosphate ABC transporter permease PstA [Ponticaulis koreensis]
MQASDLNTPISQNPAFLKRMKQRSRADQRFRYYGLLAIFIALALLVTLLVSITFEARTAFSRHEVSLDLQLTDTDSRSVYRSIRSAVQNMAGDPADRDVRIEMSQLVSRLAAGDITETLQTSGVDLSATYPVRVPVSDEADRYLKGLATPVHRFDGLGFDQEGSRIDSDFSGAIQVIQRWHREQVSTIRHREYQPALRMRDGLARQAEAAPGDRQLAMRLAGAEHRVELIEARLSDFEARINAESLVLDEFTPSVLFRSGEGWMKAVSISGRMIEVEPVISGLDPDRQRGEILVIEQPESQRSIPDAQIVVLERFQTAGRISTHFNGALFSNADSSDAEFAGVLSGLVGSIMIILVTMGLAVPVGIAAAIYLEEFAPRNRWTSFVQVNINNLAAIPSIVFGLLGAAIFVNGVIIPIPFVDGVFRLGGGLGRGWPLVGGIVLALMTLPTIIIASRAALGAVPGSVRQAALAMGATRLQTVNHHVLPMAAPGILTGSIIGLAQAIGETAPLLLIGMVAFVAEMPQGATDRATALPVLIFQWSTRAERAWEPMTSAAIIILLLVMLVLNGLAVLMRLRYEK